MAGYPPPPWHLRGWGVQTLHAVPLSRARRYVPEALPIQRISPRHTLGTLFFASYESGTLRYRELLIGIALVRLRGPRFCIPRLWVDSEASLQGGREIWHLRKELAAFDLRGSYDCAGIAARNVCALEVRAMRARIPLRLAAPALGQNAEGIYPFTATVRARASPARVRITPLCDEIAEMRLAKPLFAWRYEWLELDVPAPTPNVRAATSGRSIDSMESEYPRGLDRTR